MAIGIAVGMVQSMLNALCRNIAWTQPPAFFVQLHTADPGASGVTAVFGDARRVAATFAAADGAGAITTSADTNWVSMTAAGTVTHVSFWSASSGGSFIGSDDLNTPQVLAVGNNFTVLAGQLTLSITPVAA